VDDLLNVTPESTILIVKRGMRHWHRSMARCYYSRRE